MNCVVKHSKALLMKYAADPGQIAHFAVGGGLLGAGLGFGGAQLVAKYLLKKRLSDSAILGATLAGAGIGAAAGGYGAYKLFQRRQRPRITVIKSQIPPQTKAMEGKSTIKDAGEVKSPDEIPFLDRHSSNVAPNAKPKSSTAKTRTIKIEDPKIGKTTLQTQLITDDGSVFNIPVDSTLQLNKDTTLEIPVDSTLQLNKDTTLEIPTDSTLAW